MSVKHHAVVLGLPLFLDGLKCVVHGGDKKKTRLWRTLLCSLLQVDGGVASAAVELWANDHSDELAGHVENDFLGKRGGLKSLEDRALVHFVEGFLYVEFEYRQRSLPFVGEFDEFADGVNCFRSLSLAAKPKLVLRDARV